jgi:hypothetical protein
MRKIVLILSLFVIVSGCKVNDLSTISLNSASPTAAPTVSVALTPSPAKQIEQINSMSPETTIQTSTDPSTDKVKIIDNVSAAPSETAKENINSSENLQSFQPYLNFIKAKHPDIVDQLIFFANDDLDLDGKNEVVLAFGSVSVDARSSNIAQIYVLRDRNGDLEQLGENLALGGYSLYEIKLISLQNMPNRYIYVGVTNGDRLEGFKIFEISADGIKTIVSSASATGVGDDEIIDNNNDGQIDGFVQIRSSYDVLYYSLNKTYIWDKSGFILSGTHIEIPAYPDNIKDVLTQYLSLRALNIEKSSEAEKRLSELCIFVGSYNVDISWAVWGSALYHSTMGIDKVMDFNIKENDVDADAAVSYLGEDNKQKYQLYFHLLKTDGKWQIDKIY